MSSIRQPGDLYGIFRIVKLLGGGGNALVYEVRTPRDEPRALKVVKPGLSERDEARLVQEARMLARLEHPHVVRFFNVGRLGTEFWLLLELIRGETLRVKFQKLQPAEDVLRWIEHVCEGIIAAHGIDVLHRDIKPENIMITGDDIAKVIDFGLAKPRDGGLATTVGVVLGTTLYTAPELYNGAPASALSEVYSLGVVLYEGLAGAHPLGPPAKDMSETIRKVLFTPPKPLIEVAPDVQPDLAAAVDRAIAKDPGARWASVEAFLERLLEVHKRMLSRRRADADNVMPHAEKSRAPTVPVPIPPSVPQTPSSDPRSDPRSGGAVGIGASHPLAATVDDVADAMRAIQGQVTPVAQSSRPGTALAATADMAPPCASVPTPPTYRSPQPGDAGATPRRAMTSRSTEIMPTVTTPQPPPSATPAGPPPPAPNPLAGTLPLGTDMMAEVRAALPFVGSTLGGGIVPFPRLKVHEYASLCAELAITPQHRQAIPERYRVISEASFQALDGHWQRQFAASAELRAQFETYLAQFKDLLRKVNEYASLCAELAVSPQHRQAILERYRVISEASLQALDAQWQRQFAASPELRAQFETYLAQAKDYLRRRSG